jgi:hypothetical protein
MLAIARAGLYITSMSDERPAVSAGRARSSFAFLSGTCGSRNIPIQGRIRSAKDGAIHLSKDFSDGE